MALKKIKPIELLCLVIAGCIIFLGSFRSSMAEEKTPPGKTMADQSQLYATKWNTVDHTKLEALKGPFNSGEDITKACLSCHTKAQHQFLHAIHWTWQSPFKNSKDYGKAGYSINNFCISSNKMHDQECNTCHIGWDAKKDGINCLKCHSQADIDWYAQLKDYKEFMEMGETELADEIMADILKNVGKIGLPERRNCGECHFNGGGGEGVKHGDLDASLINPKRTLDVHMGVDGQNFRCTRCHTTVEHMIAGRVYSTPATKKHLSLVQNDLAPKITCEACHTATPHNDVKLNDHTDKVACQSCHIPTFARAHATQMWWDWSTAGKTRDGKKYQEKGAFGRPVYKSIKGDFRWEKNVVPEYFWYNGSIESITAKEIIDPSRQPIWISRPVGSRDDPESRIYPFKIHYAKQPYDMENNIFVTPLLSEENNGFWETLDWQDSVSRGMEIMGLPYSGKIGFVETNYVFPITHMVAPKEDALSCNACHSREHGRLSKLTGFYMPRRDRFLFLDRAGWGLAAGALLVVLLHALGRIFSSAMRKSKED